MTDTHGAVHDDDARRYLAAHAAVGRALRAAATLDQAAPRVLAALGVGLGWAWGALWVVDGPAAALRCRATWSALGAGAADLDALSRAACLRPGEGLPGRAWASGAPAWLGDAAAQATCPRCRAAAVAGLRGAYALPVPGAGGVLAVVEGRGPALPAPDAALLAFAEALGAHLGQFLERTRAAGAAERRFRTLVEQSPLSTQVLAPDGTTLLVNRAWERLWGVTLAQIAGYNLRQDPQLAERGVLPLIERAFAGEPVVVPPVKYEPERTIAGISPVPYRWVRGVLYPVTDEAGRVREVVLQHEDITEQVRAEEALRAAEARYRGLFAGVADALLVADARGRYVDANPAAERLLGYAREELLGLTVPDVMTLPEVETRAMYAAFVREGYWRGEVELRRQDGTLVPAEGQATVLELPDGPLYVSALRDIAERRALEREREHFLAAISHDLKTPLTAIRGTAQLVQRQLARAQVPDAARLAERLEPVVASTASMAALLDELLDQARLRTGQPPDLVRGPMDLVALARRVAAEHQRAAERHRLVVTAAVPELVAAVDAARLERVLHNLLGNAVKYSPAGGTVALGVAREGGAGGGWAVLTVRDAGVGIPAADLPHVFERYRRGGNVAGRIAGTGLGLATARQLVEAHGGAIALEGVEGRGTTVTVRLPLDAPPG